MFLFFNTGDKLHAFIPPRRGRATYYEPPAFRFPYVRKTSLFSKVLWFENRNRFDIDYFGILQPRRQVSHKPQYRSGVFHSEKCGREIQYESGLELDFIKYLEGSEDVLFYWEQPVEIPYWRGKLKARTYPDFAVYLRSRHFVIAEVKPLADMLDHRVQAKAEGIMDFCCRRGFGFLLSDGRHTPEHLLKGKVNRRLERELKTALAAGPIREVQYKAIKERCDATPGQFYVAIIRLDLKYSSYRFKLQRGNQSPIFRQVYFRKKRYDESVEERIASLLGSGPHGL